MVNHPAVPVSGSDWFEIMVDQRMRARWGHGHVSHLVVSLQGRVDEGRLAALLSAGPWPSLSRVRLVTQGLVRPAAWALAGATAALERAVVLDEQPLDDLLASLDAPATGVPIRLHLVDRGQRHDLVLSWCHAVADARSAEALLQAIVRGEGDGALPPAPEPSELRARLWAAKRARDRVLRSSLGRFASFPGRPEGPARHAVATVDRAVLRRAAAARGAGPMVGAFVVGATAHAVRQLRRRMGLPARDHLVPVPVDRRRRGAASPLLGNRLGVLMHRLPSDQLDRVEDAVAAATTSLRDLMRDDFVAAFDALWDLCRWLPPDLYAAVVGGPSLGRLASYGCSYLVSSVHQLTELAGVPVRAVHHVPSNHAPPGLTVVAMEQGSQVVVDVSWYPGMVDDREGAWLARDLMVSLEGGC